MVEKSRLPQTNKGPSFERFSTDSGPNRRSDPANGSVLVSKDTLDQIMNQVVMLRNENQYLHKEMRSICNRVTKMQVK